MPHTPKVECFFDLTSPWSYLGVTGLRKIVRQLGVAVAWRPVLVGGVFNSANPGLYEKRVAMQSTPHLFTYYLKDLTDWARFHGAEIKGVPPGHPVRAVKFMRAAIAAREQGKLLDFVDVGFPAYWRDHRDVADEAVIGELAEAAGLDASGVLARIEEQDCKDQLHAEVNDLVARGGFGVPTIFIDESDMYFGQDRLPLVRAKLEARLKEG